MVLKCKHKILEAILSVLLLTTGCASEDNRYSEARVDLKYQLQIEGQIKFRLDSLASERTSLIQVFSNDEVAFLNQANSSIDLYSLTTGVLTNRIVTEREGPDGIGRLDGFYMQGKDSIFTIDRIAYRLHLIDGTGKVKLRLNLTGVGGKIMPFISTGQAPLVRNNIISLVGLSEGDPYSNRSKYFRAASVVTHINLIDSAILLPTIQYPERYVSTIASSHFNDVQRVKGAGSVIYSFPLESTLYVYDDNDRVLQNTVVFRPDEPFTEADPYEINDAYGELNNYLKNRAFGWLLYDSTNHFYYRLMELPISEHILMNKNMSPQEKYRRDYRIMILDDSLNLIGSSELSGKTHSPSKMVFPATTGGLYIKRYSESEDSLVFDLFKPAKFLDE